MDCSDWREPGQNSEVGDEWVAYGAHSLFMRWVGRVQVAVTDRNSITEVYQPL